MILTVFVAKDVSYCSVLEAPRSPISITNVAQSGPNLKVLNFVCNLLNSQKLGGEHVAEAKYPIRSLIDKLWWTF